jgi:hypothetical chaperone protein
MSLKVGLDFGTSNSGVAVYDPAKAGGTGGHQVRLLPLDRQNVLPEVVKSVLYITRDYQCAIGQEAIRQYYLHNVNRQRRYVRQWAGEIDFVGAEMHYVRDVYVTVDELKPGRLMQYLKTALRKSPAKNSGTGPAGGSGTGPAGGSGTGPAGGSGTGPAGGSGTGTPGGYSGTQIFERWYTVGQLVQIYLEQLKMRAEAILGESIQGVTLGRPVKFADTPEQDARAEETLRQAAYGAGFKEVDFELEPVAAALDYEQSIPGPQNVVIFDFGGGTLDIAVMRLGGGDGSKVLASGGVDIAGSDFDRSIIQKRMLAHFGLGQISHQPEILELIQAVPDWMALPELATPLNRNVLEKAIRAGLAPVRLKALQALIYNDLAFTFYNRVEAAKIALSEQGATTISLEDRNIPLWELYTRSQFESDIQEYTGRVEQTLLDTLASSNLGVEQIDAVVKTGGSSSIPLFTRMLVRLFGAEKVKTSNAFSSVVAGLAIRAGGKN